MPPPHSIESIGEEAIAERRSDHRHRKRCPWAIAVADLAALVAAPAAEARIVLECARVAETCPERDDAGESRDRSREMPRQRRAVAELARVVLAPAACAAVRKRGARMHGTRGDRDRAGKADHGNRNRAVDRVAV